jgi:glycine/D-amino acid oxidase-like deaminating enzyme
MGQLAPGRLPSAMAVRVEGPGPDGMFLSADSTTRSVRLPPSDEGTLLVLEGEEHRPAMRPTPRLATEPSSAGARERFAVRSVEHRWSAHFMSPDRVGRASSGSERLLVATGFGKWGMSNGIAAAMMLSTWCSAARTLAGAL